MAHPIIPTDFLDPGAMGFLTHLELQREVRNRENEVCGQPSGTIRVAQALGSAACEIGTRSIAASVARTRSRAASAARSVASVRATDAAIERVPISQAALPSA